MKYNTISTSSLGGEGRKSTLTLYTDPDFVHSDKVSTRGELEIAQRALKLQTRRCRQLVAEYTRRLQEKEHQYQSEKLLRDNQLAKVIRTLLIFEARLKQEQKFIRHQLEEKDYIIKKQRDDINKLSNQFCKHCNQYYSPILLDDSSSEYVATDYQDYQSSNFDSSSETYATLSDYVKPQQKEEQSLFIKNKSKTQGKLTGKKIGHRKSVGTYFEVLKLRNDNPSLSSNEDNTSNDYENLESLPPEITSSNINLTEDNLGKHDNQFIQIETPDDANSEDLKISKITESIPVFEGDGETNDNWYASASDQEDDEQRDIYRNNPVLECMNQILMQNINDTLISPPKTPTVERRSLKNKRVKFSDEEEVKENVLNAENLEKKSSTANYYETPIQKPPNFYETPQSIYSNDYEQILSKCNETFVAKPKKENHYYVDMDTKSEIENEIRKTKIVRTPPAVPPKPANLLSKYKLGVKSPSKTPSIDSDPDYCSISELNLPTHKISKKLNVVAEINIPSDTNTEKHIILHSPKQDASHYDLDTRSELITPKTVEKVVVLQAKQSPTKPKPKEPEIPKLPQVSEILIPDENESKKDERITQDNYIKNNSQILKLKNRHEKRSILIGTSVSNLITSFNNQQLLSEIQSRPKIKPHKKLFSSFECLQNLEKQPPPKRNSDSYSFDLSQNFEEFKLDDCEIEEYVSEEIPNEEHVLPDIISSPKLTSSTRVELVRAINDTTAPPTAKMQQIKKKLELEKTEICNQATMKGDNEPSYEHFLECTGLSSKSILTPSRLLSNHKSVLKPKDVKLRSKVKANGLERQGSTIKYWSEPYI